MSTVLGEGRPGLPNNIGYEFMALGASSGTPSINTFVHDTLGTTKPATPVDLSV